MQNADERGSMTVAVVLGMHRSGTSAITHMLVHAGFEVPGDLVPPTPGNPRGYWEPEEIVDVHNEFLSAVGDGWSDPGPLATGAFEGEAASRARARLKNIAERELAPRRRWVLKDPRLCRLMPLWFPVLRELRIEPGFLHVVRSPLSVARSLADRDGLGMTVSLALWLRHQLEAEAATRGHQRLFIRFEDWSGNASEPVLRRLVGWGGGTLPSLEDLARLRAEVLEPDLVHHLEEATSILELSRRFPWVVTAYEAFLSLCREDGGGALRELDDLRDRLSQRDALLLAFAGPAERWQPGAGTELGPGAGERLDALEKRLERVAAEVTGINAGVLRLDEGWREVNRAQDLLERRLVTELRLAARLEATLAEQRCRLEAAESETAQLEAHRRETLAASAEIRAELEATRREAVSLAQALDHAKAELAERREELALMERRLTWRLSAPLRSIAGFAARILRGRRERLAGIGSRSATTPRREPAKRG